MVRPLIRVFILFFILNFPCIGIAQQSDLGSWWMYFGYNRIHENWSAYTEVQYRSYNMGADVQQLLLRTGMNYHINTKSSVMLGYTYIGNYTFESDISSPYVEENMIFQQFMHRHAIPYLGFEHRFRSEQRFIGDVYKNRFRYRLLLTIPFGKEKIESNTVFVAIYDELFVQDGNEWLDQNRLYGGLGYQFTSSSNFQFGIMHQHFPKRDKWLLQLALTWNPDLRKSK